MFTIEVWNCEREAGTRRIVEDAVTRYHRRITTSSRYDGVISLYSRVCVHLDLKSYSELHDTAINRMQSSDSIEV